MAFVSRHHQTSFSLEPVALPKSEDVLSTALSSTVLLAEIGLTKNGADKNNHIQLEALTRQHKTKRDIICFFFFTFRWRALLPSSEDGGKCELGKVKM